MYVPPFLVLPHWDGVSSARTGKPQLLVLLFFGTLLALVHSAPSAFTRHVAPKCHTNCTRNGNCNGDTGLCDCAFGYEGPACESRVMPACHTSHATRSPPLYGTWSLKNCWCFRQLARIGCPPIGDRECLYPALWNRSMACFEQEGLPPELQTSDVPQEGFGHPSLTWYWGQPLLGREAMNRTEPPTANQLPDGQYQLPLDACPQRCHDRGVCGGASPSAVQGTCICAASYTGSACQTAAQVDCYLSCSGGARAGLPNGTCIQGFCHCPAGRWGLACTRDEYFTSTAGWRPSHVGMRIFVYNLPQNVVHMRAEDGLHTIDTMYLGEQAFISQLLAEEPARHDSDSIPGSHRSYRFLKGSGTPPPGSPGAATGPVLTQNPWEANVFVVPTWSFWYTGNTVSPLRLFRHVIQHLRTAYPYWDELGGRNHVFFAPNDRGSCDWHHLEPELHHPIIVSHFGQAARLPPVHILLEDETHSALERRRAIVIKAQQQLPGFKEFKHMDLYLENMPCYRPEKDVVAVPVAPTWVYGISDIVYGSDHTHFNRSWDRPHTFLFSGGLRDEMMYSQGVRQAVAQLRVERQAWNRPDFVIKPADFPRTHMALSKFCLAPSGWGWGVRLAEAMGAGCVPVIVQDGVYQFLWDVLPYDEFSVRVSRRSLHRLPAILDAISPDQLEALQEGLVKWHRAFMYRSHHPRGLAYNYTLMSLRRRLASLWSAHF